MLLSTAKDLAKFVEELKRQNDCGLPLVGAALIDDRLSETLRSFFCDIPGASKLVDDMNTPLGSFSSRTEVCHALGLIDEFEYSEINLIRKVRNEFAHAKHGISFGSSRVQGLCSSLKSELPNWSGLPAARLQVPVYKCSRHTSSPPLSQTRLDCIGATQAKSMDRLRNNNMALHRGWSSATRHTCYGYWKWVAMILCAAPNSGVNLAAPRRSPLHPQRRESKFGRYVDRLVHLFKFQFN